MASTGGERGNWCLMKSEKWAGARSYRALLTRARSLDLPQIRWGKQKSWYWISFLKVNNYITGKVYETMTFRHWIKNRARLGVLRENMKWVSWSPWLSVWWTLWDIVEGIRARTEQWHWAVWTEIRVWRCLGSWNFIGQSTRKERAVPRRNSRNVHRRPLNACVCLNIGQMLRHTQKGEDCICSVWV